MSIRILRPFTYLLVIGTSLPCANRGALAADEPVATQTASTAAPTVVTAEIADAAESSDWERMASLIRAGQTVNAGAGRRHDRIALGSAVFRANTGGTVASGRRVC
ncbi:MAG UNVERIFIED_CONTAM: hypothetical protein LVR18_44525 [Planctomycetaceae bacterium]|jgi:hypothetical protein